MSYGKIGFQIEDFFFINSIKSTIRAELDKLKLRNSYVTNNSKKFMGMMDKEIKSNNLSKSSASKDKFPIIDK